MTFEWSGMHGCDRLKEEECSETWGSATKLASKARRLHDPRQATIARYQSRHHLVYGRSRREVGERTRFAGASAVLIQTGPKPMLLLLPCPAGLAIGAGVFREDRR